MICAGSESNPFDFPPARKGYDGALDRTPSSPHLVPGEKTAVFVCVGQSNMSNAEKVKHNIVHTTKVDNLNLYDGGLYRAEQPLLGSTLYNGGGCWLVLLADKLITAGTYDRVILAPIAIGSRTVQDWAPGGEYSPRIIAILRRLEALGLPVTAFLWSQGGSNFGTSQSVYAAALQNVIDVPRGMGVQSPWIIARETWQGSATDANVRAAQASVVNGVDVFSGPDLDTITGSTYRYDLVHFNAFGASVVANLWKASIEAAI